MDEALESCLLGHPLEAFRTLEPGWTCSVCLQVIELESLLRGCRACDFDVCEGCFVCEYDGVWVTSDRQTVEIHCSCIKGSLSVLRPTSDSTVTMVIGGTCYMGVASGGNQIDWSDGDVWVRDPGGLRSGGLPADDIDVAGGLPIEFDLGEKAKNRTAPHSGAARGHTRRAAAGAAGLAGGDTRRAAGGDAAGGREAGCRAPALHEGFEVSPQWRDSISEDHLL